MTNNRKISVIYIVTIIACIIALRVIPMVASAQSNVFTDPTQTVTITLEEDSTATIPTGAQVAVSNVPEDQLTEQNYADIARALYGAPSLLAYYDISLEEAYKKDAAEVINDLINDEGIVSFFKRALRKKVEQGA